MSWTVDKVMTRSVVTVRSTTGYKDLVALMSQHGISALPVVDVVDSEGQLVGIVSETDLLAKERADARRRGMSRSRVEAAKAGAEAAGDLMTAPAVTVLPEDTLARAARLMSEAHVRHLPVVDLAGNLVGIVSRSDLLKPYLRSDESIRHEVSRAVLEQTLGLKPETIEVAVADGVVTLHGELETRATADLVVRLVGSVEGVVGVRDDLRHRADTTPNPAHQ